MTKVTDAGYDEFLAVRLDQHMSTGVWSAGRWRGVYLCGGHILGRPDPLDRVANLLDGIDKRTDVSGDVVEQVDGRHGAGNSLQCVAEPTAARQKLLYCRLPMLLTHNQ